MKKTYVKPEISFESFLMSTHIAGDCEAKPNNQSNFDSCGMVFAPYVVFGSDLTGCKEVSSSNLQAFPVEPNTAYNTICYHVPLESSNIFNS